MNIKKQINKFLRILKKIYKNALYENVLTKNFETI
jgi:hypothetical protein